MVVMQVSFVFELPLSCDIYDEELADKRYQYMYGITLLMNELSFIYFLGATEVADAYNGHQRHCKGLQ